MEEEEYRKAIQEIVKRVLDIIMSDIYTEAERQIREKFSRR